MTLGVCVLGGLAGYLVRNVAVHFHNKALNFYVFSFISTAMWFIPVLSTTGVVKYSLFLGGATLKSFDQGWSEFIGGQKIYYLMKYFSVINQFLQNNSIKIYLMIFIF